MDNEITVMCTDCRKNLAHDYTSEIVLTLTRFGQIIEEHLAEARSWNHTIHIHIEVA